MECAAVIRTQLPGPEAVTGDAYDLSELVYELAAPVLQMLMAEAVFIDGLEPARHVCVSTVETSGQRQTMQDALLAHKLMQFMGPMH